MPPPKENRSGRRPGIAAVVLRFFLLPLLAFWAMSGCTVDLAADLTPAPYRPAVTSGEIANPALAEASGVAASIRSSEPRPAPLLRLEPVDDMSPQ